MDDLISRQAAIDEINNICPVDTEYDCTLLDRVDVRCVLSDLPSAQPTLYGYQIEHLALIARVMEKEGVTPEKAVETFGNISKIVQIIVEEQREIIRKVVEEWGT